MESFSPVRCFVAVLIRVLIHSFVPRVVVVVGIGCSRIDTTLLASYYSLAHPKEREDWHPHQNSCSDPNSIFYKKWSVIRV